MIRDCAIVRLCVGCWEDSVVHQRPPEHLVQRAEIPLASKFSGATCYSMETLPSLDGNTVSTQKFAV